MNKTSRKQQAASTAKKIAGGTILAAVAASSAIWLALMLSACLLANAILSKNRKN